MSKAAGPPAGRRPDLVSEADARELCGRMAKVGIACASVTFMGDPLPCQLACCNETGGRLRRLVRGGLSQFSAT